MVVEELQTAVILHQHPDQTHFDWLLVDPFKIGGSHACKTFRVLYGPGVWAEQGVICGEEIAYHRDHYLTYQGEVSGDRGFVTPVDEGKFEMLTWREEEIVAEVFMYDFVGRVTLERYVGEDAGSLWRISFNK